MGMGVLARREGRGGSRSQARRPPRHRAQHPLYELDSDTHPFLRTTPHCTSHEPLLVLDDTKTKKAANLLGPRPFQGNRRYAYTDLPPAPDAIAHSHITSGTRRTAGRERTKVMRRFWARRVERVKAFFVGVALAKNPRSPAGLFHRCCG
jgi:hypothetical protein